MPEIELDATEAQVYGPIEDGPYDVEDTDVSEVKSGPKANYVSVEMTITDGEHADRKVWNNLPVSGKAAGMFIEFWEKCTGEMLSVGEGAEHLPNTDELIGAQLTAILAMETFQCLTWLIVNLVLPS